MDEQGLLHHLLEIEGAASTLVRDAQSEAERRASAGDAEYRAAFEARCAEETAREEEKARAERAQIEERCREELLRYRESISALPLFPEVFNREAELFLFERGEA